MRTKGDDSILCVRIHFFAEHTQWTLTALRIPGGTNVTTKQHDAMAKIGAFLRRQDGSELLFHLLRVLALGKAQTTANTDAVGVTDNTAGHAIKITQQKIGGFSSHAG